MNQIFFREIVIAKMIKLSLNLLKFTNLAKLSGKWYFESFTELDLQPETASRTWIRNTAENTYIHTYWYKDWYSWYKIQNTELHILYLYRLIGIIVYIYKS